MFKVPFLDLRVSDEKERAEIHAALEKILIHGKILLGPEVEAFESEAAAWLGVKYSIGCNSGSDALTIALRALNIGPGDEVIIPSLSFIATANAVAVVGAEPVFADIGNDLNISVESARKLINSNTKAILPVHWAGHMCDISKLIELCDENGIHLIEDASQAFDAEYNGKKAGTFGTIGCFSMNCMKVFSSLGEAGLIVTNDEKFKDKCTTLRYHGLVNREYCVQIAQNSRLDTFQAAVLSVRLKTLNQVISKRRENSAYLNDRLGKYVSIPIEKEGYKHVYYTYTIQCKQRDELMQHLLNCGIETKIQHPLLLPMHPVYQNKAKGEWVAGIELIKNVLCLPANEKVSQDQLKYVADSIVNFYERD